MFGATPPPQNEDDAVLPAVARTAPPRSTRYWVTRNYREAYGLFAVNGILFNHESPRRGETFVTRKITRAVARIAGRACRTTLYLGNLDAVRDWGYAPEYVEAMWRMLQQDEPDDYVLATGVGHTVRDFAETAFEPRRPRLGEVRPVRRALPAPDRGRRADRRRRPRPRALLGWKAQTHAPELARLMVDADAEEVN